MTRQFLYLRKEEAFLVHDRVETTNPAYLPKFLLHTDSKPQSEHERLLAGQGTDDGILESSDRRMVTTHDRGRLTQIAVLPKDARFLKIGGPHFHGYVEKDSDQANGFDGVNLESAAPPRATDSKQPGVWRTELEPVVNGKQHQFLNVLLPRLLDDTRDLPIVSIAEGGAAADAVRVGRTVVVFAKATEPLGRIRVEGEGAERCLLMDAHRGGRYRVNGREFSASREGILSFDWPRGAKRAEISFVGGGATAK